MNSFCCSASWSCLWPSDLHLWADESTVVQYWYWWSLSAFRSISHALIPP
ncbi:hypothetical protein SLEP1_g58430 [Rubroshorea leprosula]|uniref:Uncharacterized protein n=1 Tax=Rubroshorea leprosula TaxID=152421 RepID=A0AAV5MSW3_9ROSI|nr:hypothetical protein SLEP1_g58430 [Rubroshorea leprosula]